MRVTSRGLFCYEQVTLPQTSSSIECNDSSELQLDVELAGLREQIVMVGNMHHLASTCLEHKQ